VAVRPLARAAGRATPAARSLLRRDADGIAWLTLNRPAARNALSMGLMEALDAELVRIADRPRVKVVVIGGAGPAFCAGHDMREMRATPTARQPTRRPSRSARA
jgi:enoyl-CoA hydratase/carnithine racemase